MRSGCRSASLRGRSGVTNGLISQIEQNRSSPSVSSLKRILDALPMSLSEFFADDFPDRQKIFYGKTSCVNSTR